MYTFYMLDGIGQYCKYVLLTYRIFENICLHCGGNT